VNLSLSDTRKEKASKRTVLYNTFLAAIFMVGGASPSRAAEPDSGPQLGGTPISVEVSRPGSSNTQPPNFLSGELNQLKSLILNQNKAIEDLKEKLKQQESMIQALQKQRDPEKGDSENSKEPSDNPESASLLPLSSQATTVTQGAEKKVVVVSAESEKPVNALSVGGFKFSGDFRFRLDMQARSGNEIAPPLQNVRSRYRVRLNVDKEIDRMFNFHLQLSTGPYNVGTTNDQDFAGTVAKHPFSVAEAYVDFHPNSKISLRGGRMEQVFADNMRFLWDDDVRFNGFQQVIKLPINADNSLEFRAGEYWLSNPNVAILSATSPFIAAGFEQGQKVRDTNLFHPGIVLNLSGGGPWRHKFGGDVQIYRNPNEIQLASTANGFPVLVSPALGLALSGPMSAAGNATTTPGGAIYTAPDFHIARAYYRIEHKGVKMGEREMPLWFDFQVSRNFGAGFLRDAVMGSVNLGNVKKAGDLRFLYQYAIKDANSIISQFTDDDLGTGTGVNLAVHAMRFDVGLTRFLVWQNLFFIQHARRSNNPAELFFVPLQEGANTTFRYLGQLAFSF
jgi:Putative porin